MEETNHKQGVAGLLLMQSTKEQNRKEVKEKGNEHMCAENRVV